MKTFRFVLPLLCAMALVAVSVAGETKHNVSPKDGLVPNAETAIKIAEAVWLPIYGDGIFKKKPFKARLVGDVWVVEGTLPLEMVGGVPLAEISKKDGKILRVSHGQ
ncbi:YbbC/YhhH family protein [Sulfuricaulis limicola]|nr:YbbC/YhhH family protein [Sulfuricaulis limicola]